MWESADDTRSLTWREFSQAAHQFDRTGRCTHPIRLSGRVAVTDLATGELRPVYDTATGEPGRVLHVSTSSGAHGALPRATSPVCETVFDLNRTGHAVTVAAA